MDSLEPPMIRAEVHADNFAETAKFDALAWFGQAGKDEIVALARCGWGGDYPADDVARFFDGRPGFAAVSEVFAYASRHRSGFECHVHDNDALAWIEANRPEVFAALCEALDETPETLRPLRAGTPGWDRDSSWSGGYETGAEAAAAAPGPR